MGYNLVVSDAQINAVNQKISDYFTNLGTVTLAYDLVINRILKEGIISGQVHTRLERFKGYMPRLRTILKEAEEHFHQILPDFLSEIEKADSYLYDAEILEKPRNFSQDLYEMLQAYIQWSDGEVGSAFETFIISLFAEAFDFLAGPDGVGLIKKKMQEDLGALMRYNRETRLGLKNLFDQVHTLDREYAGKLDLLVEVLKGIASLIQDMAAAADPANQGAFSLWTMTKLDAAMQALEKKCREIKEIDVNKNAPPTTEEIRQYVNRSQSTVPGFDSIGNRDDVFLDKYSAAGAETWAGVVFFEFMDINTDVLTNQLKGIFGEEMTYAEYLELRNMAETLDNISESSGTEVAYSREAEEFFTWLKEFVGVEGKTVEDVYKALNKLRGADGKKILDGRTREAKKLKVFIDRMDKVGKYLEAGVKGVEALEILFSDFSRQQDIIDSLKESAGDSESVQATVRRLQKLYENRWTVLMDKIGTDAGDLIFDELFLKGASKLVPGLDAAVGAIDLTGKITGLCDKYKAVFNAYQMMEAVGTSRAAYSNAVQAFRNAGPDDPNYEKLAENVSNTFELYKNSLEKKYLNMAAAMSGDEKAYYQYCAQQVHMMSMKKPAPVIMTYQEYIAQDDGTGAGTQKQ